MPCFKGIAVSIHANGAPLAEHGVQKQTRVSRINTYIAVPQPQMNPNSNKAEPAKFAISITLLTPDLPIPYSTPRATESNPHPKPQCVGGVRCNNSDVAPYIPMTNNENETIAAYIYFDGRPKEEVATLLRPGEETWVNSRWVQVPESEGGGLAEREFLFREVGLERWLNGLDLQGPSAAEKLERRRQRFERRRRRPDKEIKDITEEGDVDIKEDGDANGKRSLNKTFRYGNDEKSPVEVVMDGDDDSELSSDDDEPPEAAGQIKVAMFRVIASGEIKKGEYSPQFDAHDDDEDFDGGQAKCSNDELDADVEHTTSFAKPKTLDPKTISTQTVTGIDGPEKPFATFTFFYRGERQLQKMGLLSASKPQQSAPTSTKRRSGQLDFSSLGPLKTTGTVGFSSFRDRDEESARRRKSRKKSIPGTPGIPGIPAGKDDGADDSDDDESDDAGGTLLAQMEEDSDVKTDKFKLIPEDTKASGELVDGVNRIRLKRAHSAEPGSAIGSSRKSLSAGPGEATPPEGVTSNPSRPSTSGLSIFGNTLANGIAHDTIGSPLKKARPSLGGDSAAAPLPPAAGAIPAKVESAMATQTALQDITSTGKTPGDHQMEEEL